ncbi:MAG: hypothetical protein HYR94_29240, partial [Chloroflexi bacterium]|nr:hypothetical protein [Chloroflexota bacterium]
MKTQLVFLFTVPVGLLLLLLLALGGVRPTAAQSLSAPPIIQLSRTPLLADTPLDKAYQHLEEVMDKYHQTFDVYTDLSAGGNHFNYLAMMGCGATIDSTFTKTVHSGATAIKNTFTPPQGWGCPDWGGWYFQNGVLTDTTVGLQPNWGDYPNAGYNLSGTTKLTFWVRGEQGGERVEFFVSGIGWDEWGHRIAPFPDSSSKVFLCDPCDIMDYQTTYITLTNTWQPYTITLTYFNMNYVIGGFGWATNTWANDNQNITFYLDDIHYDKPHLNDLRVPVSFETISSTLEFDTINKNVAFTYDVALALMAFTARDDKAWATALADAFVYCQEHDRYYTDGRLRNAYQAGDLILPPGWTPNGRIGTCRVPGWWDTKEQKWVEDAEYVGSGTGNLAWALIALLNYYERWGGEKYLTTAITLGNWIETHTRDTRGVGGYTGGYKEWEPTPISYTWKSTEHNLDLYVAFQRLYRITGEEKWRTRAEYARNLVEAMWNEPEGFYWTGTHTDGITINKDFIPLDTQTWSLQAFGPNNRTQRAINY